MLIHELSSAVQHDRERAVGEAMTARRHLWGVCTGSGVADRVRHLLGRGAPPRHPRVPAARPDLRPTR